MFLFYFFLGVFFLNLLIKLVIDILICLYLNVDINIVIMINFNNV